MKRVATVLAVASLAASRVLAQSPNEPHLVFTISAGLTSGGDLWTLPAHPQPVIGGGANVADTMALGRVLRPGLVAGLSGAYYISPRFGWSAEVTYFGVSTEQRCVGPATYQPESDNINRQACDRANGQHVETSVVGFLAGATYRLFPDARVQPFVRATVGPGLLGNSFVQTSGIVQSAKCQTSDGFCNLTLADERGRTQVTFVANFSAGFSFALSQAYRVRFEGRDVITSVPRATGNGDGSSSNPAVVRTGRTIKHVPTFTMGFDIILERRHTRRY